MKKFKIVGDPNNPERFSSHIIISALNEAAKRQKIYSENGAVVVYDCLGSSHGQDADALIVSYECIFPRAILDNCKNKLVIGVGLDNYRFALEGGHPKELTNYINLGIDTKTWKPIVKKNLLDKFVVLVYSESLVRGGYSDCIQAFGELFSNNPNAVLYLKDRNGTEQFAKYVEERANFYNFTYIYDNRHIATIEEELEVFASADCHLYLNYCSTFAMPCISSIAVGLPTIAMNYCGPKEYLIDGYNGLFCKHNLVEITQSKIEELQSIGARNFFFQIDKYNYATPPVWATPDLDSIKDCLTKLATNKALRQVLAENGPAIAKTLTWDRAALNLAGTLDQV